MNKKPQICVGKIGLIALGMLIAFLLIAIRPNCETLCGSQKTDCFDENLIDKWNCENLVVTFNESRLIELAYEKFLEEQVVEET